MILAGDIGGTKTRLALFQRADRKLKSHAEKTYISKDYKSLNALARQYLDQQKETIERACFGLPGPIKNGVCQTTNLPWIVEAKKLSQDLNGIPVGLLNDVEANAYGIAELRPDELITLQEGELGATGNAALLSPGTGLGQAGLYWDGRRHRPFACEGGHVDFGPTTELDTELFLFLKSRHHRVSWERVLSGQGLTNIYQFLLQKKKQPEPAWLTKELHDGDAGAAISKAALAGTDPLCQQALDILVRYYGAQAGNLALTFMAWGGVYIGGGIAPKILEKLRGPELLAAFLDKGRLSAILKAMPLRVILNPDTAMLGAAHYADVILSQKS